MKNLKARLSEYLRSVKAGETILVTEREHVIAEIRPATGRVHAEGSLPDALATLAEAGEVTAPVLPKARWAWSVRGLGLPSGTTRELLDDVRADRG